MSMSKKDFIALADVVRGINQHGPEDCRYFDRTRILVLASFCQSQNPRFNRERWLAYIAGECGPNGGVVRFAYCEPCEKEQAVKQDSTGPECAVCGSQYIGKARG